ncbi:MAG TPA: carboxypeptidase regulatory-like domain-containing protein [Vicinamibacterales bacterium]
MVRLLALVLILPLAGCLERHVRRDASTAATQTSSSARVTGRVLDASTGEPIAGVRASLAFAARVSLPRLLPEIQTDADGVFTFGDLPPGSWRVHVQKRGYYYGTAGQPPVIEVVEGAATTVTILLERGGAVTGRVLDSRGLPVGDLWVTALQPVQRPDGTIMSMERATERTNDLGEFRLAGLPPGDYYVVARLRVPPFTEAPLPSKTMFVETYYPGAAGITAASPVVVTLGATTQSIDFQMRSAAAYHVLGVAVDARGRPAAGARILLSHGRAGTITTIFDGTAEANGTFRIVNVPEGTYRVQADVLVVTRSGTGSSTSAWFHGAPVEILVQGGDVTGVRVTAGQP